MRGRAHPALPPLLSIGALVLAAAGNAPAARPAREGGSFGILETLVNTPGVSTREQEVRERIQSLLPSWARPEVDPRGNLLVAAGPERSAKTLLFIAHMDETGYLVTAIREDGTLDVRPVGGFFETLYEGQVVLVHTAKGDVGGVVPPRPGYLDPSSAESPATFGKEAVRVDLGASSRAVAEGLGITAGDPVTVPKAFQKLYGSYGSGRAVDDRAGCTALLVALRALDPKTLRRRAIFAFSVEEETGLEGAKALSRTLRPDLVIAVDTFVSSDSPLERPAFAHAVLGKGPVVRAIDSSNITDPALLERVLTLARQAGVPVQYGLTRGGNDGSVFPELGTPDLALSWPTVHSHSAVEVIHEKDLDGLGALVRLIAERW
jgi:putative aminopeptidase FrvX